jgi:phosphate transport system substrate-binding protein
VTRHTFRRIIAPTVATLAMASTLAACGGDSNGAEGNTGSTGGGGLSGTVSAGGSSAQEAAMAAWRSGFQTDNPSVTINYEPVGSGGGREQFTSGGYPFAGTDSYLDDTELKAAQKQCGAAPIEVPTYVSPIAVIYNVPGVDDLKLDAETLAGIFAGKITTWNDPAITTLNPDADLPSDAISPVHRSDESGTSENFTAYLSEAAPDAWTYGSVGEWPLKSGEGAQGTSGVVSAVTNGSGTIGYADESQAGDLSKASIKVGSEYVGPTADAASKILDISPAAKGQPKTSMAVEVDRKTSDSGVYPIVLVSYVVACPSYSDQSTADIVKGFLSYVVSPEGQQAAAKAAGSAPLSDQLSQKAATLVDQIKAG